MLYTKILNIFVYAIAKKLNAMFLANAKSDFGAIVWLFYGFSLKNGFPYANQLWKARKLLYEMEPSLIAFVKHLHTEGMFIFLLFNLSKPLILSAYKTKESTSIQE